MPASQPEKHSSATNQFLLSTSSGMTSPFIGRESDLGYLLDRWYVTLQQCSLQSLLIIGSPGIGKSRLLHTFLNQIHSSPDPFMLLFDTTAPPIMSRPYGLLSHLLLSCFNLTSQDTPPTAVAKITAVVTQHLGESATDLAKIISSCMGYAVSSQTVVATARQEDIDQQRVWHALTQFLLSYASHTPIVLAVDDLQWADEASLAFLIQFVAVSHAVPIYVVLAARPNILERATIWQQPAPHLQQHHLQHLSPEASSHLVAELLRPAQGISSDLIRLLTDRAEGHPFYLTALIQMLIADGIIETSSEPWKVRIQSLTRLRIPATLKAVVQARLDALRYDERHLLEQAAVVGRVFWDTTLVFIAQSDEEQMDHTSRLTSVHERLTTLIRNGFVLHYDQSTSHTPQTYRFHHDLLHEAIYESIAPATRQRHHLLLAQWFMRQPPQQIDDSAGQIAEHYEHANAPTEAAQWYARAGKYAYEHYALPNAITLYQRALALLPDTSQYYNQSIELAIQLGILLQKRARYAEAETLYLKTQKKAESIGDISAQARIWAELAKIYWVLERYQLSLSYAEQSDVLAQQIHDETTRVSTLLIKGRTLQYLGDYRLARQAANDALAISTQNELHTDKATSLRLIAGILVLENDYEQAASYEDQALALYRSLGDQYGIAIMLNNQASSLAFQAKYDQALTVLEEALDLTQSIGYRDIEIWSLCQLVEIYNNMGRYVEAEAYARKVMSLNNQHTQSPSTTTHTLLAHALLGQQKLDEALTEAQYGLELAQRSDDQMAIGEAWCVLGMVVAQLPDHIGAPHCFAESERSFVNVYSTTSQADTLREWAQYELTRGDKQKGELLWQQAYAIFEQLGLTNELDRMQQIRSGCF